MTAHLEHARAVAVAVDACVELISRQRHGVGFPELAAACERVGVATSGGEVLWSTIPNLCLWAGISLDFASICSDVHKHPDVILRSSAAAAFDEQSIIPAAVADLPIASWPPCARGYATPHLLPTALGWRRTLAGAPRPTGSSSPKTTRKDHR